MPPLNRITRQATQQLILALDWLREEGKRIIVRWAWFLRINVFCAFIFAVSWIGISQWAEMQYFVLNGSPSKPETVQIAEEEVGNLYQQWKYSRYSDYLNLLLFRVEKLHQFYPQSRVIEKTLNKMLDKKTAFLKRSNNRPFYIFNFKINITSK